MRFKKIKIKNIRSYKEQEIIFPEGSLLLSGEIGSGKTSILLALEYALFGLQPGQKGNSLLRNISKIGEVTLELEVAGDTVMIERKLKRTPRGISNEYASITINNEKSESSVTEIKSKIVSLLGYPPEFVKKNNMLYRYTVYSPQEQMKQIILEDAETRLNLLRHIFGIDKYKKVRDNLAILLYNLKTETKILQLDTSTLEKEIEDLKIRKKDLEKIKEETKVSEFHLSEKVKIRKEKERELEEIKTKLEERRAFKEEIEKTKILLATRKENISFLLKQEDELKKAIKESAGLFSEETYRDLLFSLIKRKENVENLLSNYAEFSTKLRALDQEKENVLVKKERIFKIQICPTCLQDVSEVHKHNILNETENRLSEISKQKEVAEFKLKEVAQDLSRQRSELQKQEDEKFKMEVLKSKLEQTAIAKEKLREIEKQKKNTESDIEILTQHIEGLKEKISEYSTFELQLKKKEEDLKEAFKEEKNSEISLAEIKKEIEFAKREISFFEERIKQKEETKKRLYELNELNDWLSTKFSNLVELVERSVLLRLRTEFSSLFRKWFSILVQENSLDSHIDENFTPLILQGEAEMDYDFLSGGERTAIALAYRLALNQTINSLLSKIKTRGIIILDEPTDGFSEAQIERMRDILDELNAEQLIIVSHEQKIESFVDNVLRIHKEENSSFVEYQEPVIVREEISAPIFEGTGTEPEIEENETLNSTRKL